ncbi:MAG: SUF system Fe-S cluster assembly regulator [Myxococcaceae bacterium]
MIRVQKLTDYAIVLMAELAEKRQDSVWTARELSEQSAIPITTVSKLLKQLHNAGWLGSSRGPQGGYFLAQKPGKISLLQLIEAFEGPMQLTDCGSTCQLDNTCPTQKPWQRINQILKKTLSEISLADMSTHS